MSQESSDRQEHQSLHCFSGALYCDAAQIRAEKPMRERQLNQGRCYDENERMNIPSPTRQDEERALLHELRMWRCWEQRKEPQCGRKARLMVVLDAGKKRRYRKHEHEHE